MEWLRRPHALVLTAALALQIAVSYGVARRESEPPHIPLAKFPVSVGGWTMAQEGVVEKDVREVLKADDVISRVYMETDAREAANLFVAYFKSQRTGAVPHSPKHCLPGAGWVPSVSDFATIPVPGRAAPIRVNRYLVARGDDRSVVLYWYQSHGRVMAGEFEAKLFLVADAIRYNRTDTALVRVVLPVAGEDVERTTRIATEFVRAIFGPLIPFLGPEGRPGHANW